MRAKKITAETDTLSFTVRIVTASRTKEVTFKTNIRAVYQKIGALRTLQCSLNPHFVVNQCVEQYFSLRKMTGAWFFDTVSGVLNVTMVFASRSKKTMRTEVETFKFKSKLGPIVDKTLPLLTFETGV